MGTQSVSCFKRTYFVRLKYTKFTKNIDNSFIHFYLSQLGFCKRPVACPMARVQTVYNEITQMKGKEKVFIFYGLSFMVVGDGKQTRSFVS